MDILMDASFLIMLAVLIAGYINSNNDGQKQDI